jgi:hypothetical protein
MTKLLDQEIFEKMVKKNMKDMESNVSTELKKIHLLVKGLRSNFR